MSRAEAAGDMAVIRGKVNDTTHLYANYSRAASFKRRLKDVSTNIYVRPAVSFNVLLPCLSKYN